MEGNPLAAKLNELESLRAAIADGEKDAALILYSQAQVFMLRFKYDEAVQSLEEAIKLDPENAKYSEALAEARRLSNSLPKSTRPVF